MRISYGTTNGESWKEKVNLGDIKDKEYENVKNLLSGKESDSFYILGVL